jgi:hypothetical protein
VSLYFLTLVFGTVGLKCNPGLLRRSQAGRKETRHRLGQLAGAEAILRHVVTDGGDRSARQAISNATFPIHDDGRDLRTGSSGVANSGGREAQCPGELRMELGQ